jgi:hypothetical protein
MPGLTILHPAARRATALRKANQELGDAAVVNPYIAGALQL